MSETFGSAFKYVSELLREHGVSAYMLEANELLRFACGSGCAFPLRADYVLDREQRMRLDDAVARRIGGEPCAYIIGEWDFYSGTFAVNPDVLIPRQDTETLIDAARDKLCALLSHELKILDLCCGSGCIGITLAEYFKNSEVTLCDISQKALYVAAKNIELHGLSSRVRAVRSDMFSALNGRFDLIASNPPYIRSADIALLDSGVRDFEPRAALDGGADGLDFYREISAHAPEFLNPGGALLVECGYDQAEAVRLIFSRCGFFDRAEIINDLSGVPRVVLARC